MAIYSLICAGNAETNATLRYQHTFQASQQYATKHLVIRGKMMIEMITTLVVDAGLPFYLNLTYHKVQI